MSEDGPVGDGERILSAATRWAEAWANVRAETIPDLLDLADEDIRFKDPFNDVTGKGKLARILRHMFESCDEPSFEIIDIAASDARGYIRWRFAFKTKRGSLTRQFEGMSEIEVGEDGLIRQHIDHWDAASQLLARLPLIGFFVRRILKSAGVD